MGIWGLRVSAGCGCALLGQQGKGMKRSSLASRCVGLKRVLSARSAASLGCARPVAHVTGIIACMSNSFPVGLEVIMARSGLRSEADGAGSSFVPSPAVRFSHEPACRGSGPTELGARLGSVLTHVCHERGRQALVDRHRELSTGLDEQRRADLPPSLRFLCRSHPSHLHPSFSPSHASSSSNSHYTMPDDLVASPTSNDASEPASKKRKSSGGSDPASLTGQSSSTKAKGKKKKVEEEEMTIEQTEEEKAEEEKRTKTSRA